VIETKSRAHFPERLLEFFPTEPDLAALGAASYMGTSLLNADGTLLGHLAVLDNRPMPAEPHLYALFDLFAVLDTEFKITRLNPRARELFAFPAEPADPDLLPPLLKGFKAVPPFVTDLRSDHRALLSRKLFENANSVLANESEFVMRGCATWTSGWRWSSCPPCSIGPLGILSSCF
jgi:PAS domain-containing protein